MTSVNEVSLRVAEGLQEDVGKIRVRIDPEIMQKLNIQDGACVEILGKKATGAVAFQSNDGDIGKGIIRMDGLVRGNAGTSLGELVNCKVISLKPAKKVAIAPSQKEYKINDPDFLQKTIKEYLMNNELKR